jgi:hypothetical protein
MTIINTLEQKAVGLRILNLGMDTQTPTGKLIVAACKYKPQDLQTAIFSPRINCQ